MTNALSPVDSYRIDMPNAWRSIPVKGDGLREALLPQHDQWARLDAPDRRRVELFIQRIGNDLASTNTTFCAVFAELVEDDRTGETDNAAANEPTEHFGVLLASCTLSTLTRADLGSPLELRPEVILRAMSLRTSDQGPQPTNLDPPSIIELPAGRAVRLARLIPAPTTLTTDELFVETFLLPVPPDHETVAMMQFATPCLNEVALFSELFASIAATFVIYREGDET